MTKQEFLTYLPKHTSGILSTIGAEGTPDGRGFEFQYEENDRYYFGTANPTDVWKQLAANPKAAFTYMEPTGKFTVRIHGDIHIITDQAEKKAVFDRIDPLVQKMYKSFDNPVFELIYFDHPTCRLAKGFGTSKLVAD